MKVPKEEKGRIIYIASLGLSEKIPDWIVTPHFAFHIPTKYPLSKNFLLMLKDVPIVCCMSQLSMMNRADGRGGVTAVKKLRDLYDAGDKILTEHGNNA